SGVSQCCKLSGVGHSRNAVTLYSYGLAANLNGFTSVSKAGKMAVAFMAVFPFTRVSRRRQNNCRIWCAGRWGARHRAHTLRKGVARRNGVDSNESPNAKEYSRRRGGWRREIPAKSICRQPRPVRIAAAIASARNPKLFASAIRGWRCAWQMLVAFPRRLMIADRRLLVLLLPLIICFS